MDIGEGEGGIDFQGAVVDEFGGITGIGLYRNHHGGEKEDGKKEFFGHKSIPERKEGWTIESEFRCVMG